MKKIILLVTFISLIISACSSSTDEPELEYTGPWEIEYIEEYIGWHTSDPAFKLWFEYNINNFESASFANYSHSQVVFYTKDGGDWIEWSDYKTWYEGVIEWSEIINDATEDEIKSKVDAFNNFSSDDGTPNGKSDLFNARYRKLPNVD